MYNDLFSPTDYTDTYPGDTLGDTPGDTWLTNIKHLLVDSEVVANLFVRLSNKYNEYTTTNNKTLSLQQIHMARTTYDVITHNNLTNFAHVLSHILSYIGLIK